MDENFAIQLFEGKRVRIVWDAEQEKYYFSVVDIVQVLTDSADYQTARKYWKVLKGRLLKEGNETVTNCYQLKLPAAGIRLDADLGFLNDCLNKAVVFFYTYSKKGAINLRNSKKMCTFAAAKVLAAGILRRHRQQRTQQTNI